MGSFTELTQTEIQQILSYYGDQKVLQFTPLSLGISNSNYKVDTSNSSYILKISNDKQIHQLEDEMLILNCLKEYQFPYSLCPIKTKKGQNIYSWESHFGVLFPYIQAIAPKINIQTCEQIGKALATLHQLKISPDDLSKIRPYERIGQNYQSIKNFLNNSQCPEDFKDCFEKLIKSHLQDFGEQDFSQGIIHGDLYYDNTLFQNNQLKLLIDFEQAGLGKFIWDLGISISGTCLQNGRVNPPLVEHFLKGYQQIRKMPEKELNFINQAIILGLFSISLWRIERFTIGDLDPNRKDSYKELLTRATLYHQIIHAQI